MEQERFKDRERKADRLLLQASQLRIIAEQLEQRGRTLRPDRRPFPRGTFDALYERDKTADSHPDDPGPDELWCAYCWTALHRFDPTHKLVADDCGDELCHDRDGLIEGRCAEVDHVMPLSQGGLNDLDNLVLACGKCNRKKGARTMTEWVADHFVEAVDRVLANDSVNYVSDLAMWEAVEIIRSLRERLVRPTLVMNGKFRCDGWAIQMPAGAITLAWEDAP